MAMIVEQKVWDDSYKDFDYFVAEDRLTQAIDSLVEQLHVAPLPGGRCFEVGCFPCRYLAHWAKRFGLEANGVDLTSEIRPPLLQWLESQGVRCGEIFQDDAFACAARLAQNGQQFDFVYSVGFLEHFVNYLDVVDLHDKLLRSGGLLVLACPNFHGWVQNLLHRWTDSTNLSYHVVPSMDPSKWARHLGDGYDILFQGHVGGFDYWCGQGQSRREDLLARAVLHLKPFWSKVCRNSPAYSPYCLLIARKK